jgi:NADPH:quinone reductase-like Zn-dependent oxidoreductase
MDFSGVIEKVGDGVSSSDLKQGDEVYKDNE